MSDTQDYVNAFCPLGHISSAKRHKTVDEIWYFVSGSGQLWRKNDREKEIVTDIESELSVTIPVGTHFQFKNTGDIDLVILIVTSPIWPGEEEAAQFGGVHSPHNISDPIKCS